MLYDVLECFLHALSVFINSIVLQTNDIPVKNILMRVERKSYSCMTLGYDLQNKGMWNAINLYWCFCVFFLSEEKRFIYKVKCL